MQESYLQLRNISKRFPGVQALDSVDLDVRRGEVHALVGENGAGKSTLMNVLGGTVRPDEGTIVLDGQTRTIDDPIASMRLGIGFVHQESSLLPNLTVRENVFLARERLRGGLLDANAMRREIRKVSERFGYHLDPDARVSSLTLAEQQSVEITRAVLSEPKLLILDEPTAALDDSEVAHLFEIIRRLREENVAIIYLSHRLDEIFQVADRITVLKDGRKVATEYVRDVDRDRVIALMVGRVLEDIYPDRRGASFGDAVLEVRHLSIPGRVRDVSFTVRAGEIVGLGGLEGQGQREVLRAVFGDVQAAAGSVSVCSVPLKGSIRRRIRSGVAYATHDRRGEGLVLTESMRRNEALASLEKREKLGFVQRAREKQAVSLLTERMQIRAASMEQSVTSLSGGNQQKVMLARWLMTEPRRLIIDEPTKGVDVGARMSVYRIMDDLTRSGIAILMLTSDMMELIGLSDRVLVFYEGAVMRELSRDEVTEERIMRAASGVREEA